MFLGYLDSFFPSAGTCSRLGETFGDVDEAGSADSLDTVWTLITGSTGGDLTDVFLPESPAVTIVTDLPAL